MEKILQLGYFFYGKQESYKILTKLFGNLAYIVAALIGIPANIIVIKRIIQSKDFQKSASYLIILNLAIADLLFLSGTPLLLYNSLLDSWNLGIFLCKAFLSSNAANHFASSIFMGLLAFDRYLAICCKKDFLPWLIVFVAILPLFHFGNIVYFIDNKNDTAQLKKAVCMLVWSPTDDGEFLLSDSLDFFENVQFSRRIFTAYTFAVGYVIPLIAVWLFYANIIYTVRKHGSSTIISNNHIKRRTFKITRLGVLIAVIYTFCWLPFWFVQWSIEEGALWTLKHNWLMAISYFAYVLGYFNSVINPFTFITFSNKHKHFTYKNSQKKKLKDKKYGILLDNH
ncbi:G protein-coupled receptor, rhodopsin-like family and GPCR, rhodopsin-like, 7TM domain-containing protein [Strongyloides ratti]|uniref:G protein-coupled receptor, rhodopsin-like family and GPCR, rhodopsin-like, 7TM domain-containing protein n=1 Tax=Strongyloides ratti TaxID=34506 RepID=A0A090KS87_STRRB|nr:G protein-coupled receptor, rhodopsin-like family and GPCR, rhodopsin-like, 7TM domain-containing protein [Strongyloides ratti]CEF60251.1 G protein-coupled receptor, rhodopsin-like family and GPCR, rhodopsin-like, 7TM domain-containing protein [Strongyloides ratti]